MEETIKMNLSSINTNVTEGRLLMAAMAMLTTESRTNQTPDQCLADVITLADKMYEDAVTPGAIVDPAKLEEVLAGKRTFENELRELINKYSKENDSDTPDFLLQEFLSDSLDAYSKTVKKRDEWFGVDMWDRKKD